MGGGLFDYASPQLLTNLSLLHIGSYRRKTSMAEFPGGVRITPLYILLEFCLLSLWNMK